MTCILPTYGSSDSVPGPESHLNLRILGLVCSDYGVTIRDSPCLPEESVLSCREGERLADARALAMNQS